MLVTQGSGAFLPHLGSADRIRFTNSALPGALVEVVRAQRSLSLLGAREVELGQNGQALSRAPAPPPRSCRATEQLASPALSAGEAQAARSRKDGKQVRGR